MPVLIDNCRPDDRHMPRQAPAMANGRCPHPWGHHTGQRTAEGIENIRKAHWKHGRRSAEAVGRRKQGMALRREIRRLSEMARALE